VLNKFADIQSDQANFEKFMLYTNASPEKIDIVNLIKCLFKAEKMPHKAIVNEYRGATV